MIRWRYYTDGLRKRGTLEFYTQHTLAFKVFGRYLIITWVWD